MKKKKIKKYGKVFEKNYLLYREQYKEHRKEGLIKANQRPLTKQQFNEISKTMGRGDRYAVKQVLMSQSKTSIFTKGEITKIWKQYQKEYKEQGKIKKLVGKTWHYIKDVDLSKEISRKFKTVNALLKNLKTNQLIQLLVDSGYDREEVLEEYGY